MTAMFGVLTNTTDTPITVSGGTSPSAAMVELHEVVMRDGASVMQPKQGGFTLPAKGAHELSPGKDHVMLMQLKRPLKVGDTVTVNLTLSDGSTLAMTGTAKAFTAANENYETHSAASASASSGSSMGSMASSSANG